MPQPDSNIVVIRRRMHATPEQLFDAWTDAEGMRTWMCPGNIMSVDVHMDLRLGGSLLVIMRDPDKVYEHRGEFTIIERPTKLAFTWIAQATDLHPTLVTLEFFAVSDSETDLVLTHERFPRKDASDRYRGGWNQIVDSLEKYLRSKH